MHIESAMLAGWVALPLVAYTGGRAAIWWSGRRAAQHRPVGAAERLAELRRRPQQGSVVRGRMAEAVRLAEGPASSSLTAPRV